MALESLTAGLERRHLLLLFVAGLGSRGFVKSLLGEHASLLLLFSLALYFIVQKRKSVSIYDDVARMQAEAAAKLDALHGVGDGTVTPEVLASLHSRQTQFHLNESERMIITDRMHQHSHKMRGSRSDRKKFLRKRRTHEELVAAIEDGPLNPELKPASSATAKRTTTSTAATEPTQSMETIVEQAVNDTI